MNRVQEKCWDCLCNLTGEEVLSILDDVSHDNLMSLLSVDLQKNLEQQGYLDDGTPDYDEE